MFITPERKVPQRSDASQNDHKSKGYPSGIRSSIYYAKGGYRRLKAPCAAAYGRDFQKSDFPALDYLCTSWEDIDMYFTKP